MAIAQVDISSANATASTLDVLNVDVSGSNTVLYACISSDTGSQGSAAYTCVWDSAGANQALTEIAEIGNPGQYQAIFRLINPTAGLGKTVSFGGMSAIPNIGIVASYSGVDQTSPNGTVNQVEQAAGGPSTAVSSGTVTCAAGNWIVSFLSVDGNGAGIALSNGTARLTHQAASLGDDRDGVDDTMDWTWTADNRVSVQSFELKAAAAGGGGTTMPVLLQSVRQQEIC